MPKTIGLIQTQGIGDLVIALPIATYFTDRGARVLWPVSELFVDFMQRAAPWIEFIGVPPAQTREEARAYLYDRPRAILEARGCDEIHSLYSRLEPPVPGGVNEAFARSLKFDEYKYAVTGVPFEEKWNLRIERDLARETALFDHLAVDEDYVCVHAQGSTGKEARFDVPPQWRERYRIIPVEPITDSPFDWLYLLEGAAKLVLFDSVFANLVEQLGLPNEKYFILRSPVGFTPVLKHAWTILPGSSSGMA